jgi:soluble lytic murein transglycosylase-like protein
LQTAHARTLVLTALTALSLSVFTAGADALPVDQYLKLRRDTKFNRQLAYADVVANPAACTGKVIELRGTVNGAIRRENAVAFMLTMPDRNAVLLNAPAADSRMVSEVTNQGLRVLARVSQTNTGNVVPLEVLGVAYEAEVALKEKEAEEAARVAAAAGPREEPPAPAVTQKRFASRGGQPQMAASAPELSGGEASALARQSLSGEALALYPIYRAFIQKQNRRLSETELDQITTAVLYFAAKHQVDPRLVCALIIAESNFNPRVTSHKGAMGLGQLMPYEAASHGIRNAYEPIDNIRACVNLMRQRLNKYSEGTPPHILTRKQVTLALASYNAGAGAVKKYGGVPPYKETQNYVKKILKMYDELCGISPRL